MNAFLIKFRKQEIRVPIGEDEVTAVHLFDKDGEGSVMIHSFNRSASQSRTWEDFATIAIGDIIEIDIIETNESMTPASKIVETHVPPKKSKLELFRELETDLRKRGLI